VVIPDDDLRRS